MTIFCTICTISLTYHYYYLTWLMFSFNLLLLLSFTCYYLLTKHSLVVVATVLLYYILNTRTSRSQFCRRLDHQRTNSKKCTLIKFWQSGRAEADFVIDWTIRKSIQRNVLLSNYDNRADKRPIWSLVGPSENQSKEMYSYQIMTIGKTRGPFCRRLDHQKINPKKCTLNKFWQSGRAGANFVVGWTIKVSIQRNVLLSNFDNREDKWSTLS